MRVKSILIFFLSNKISTGVKLGIIWLKVIKISHKTKYIPIFSYSTCCKIIVVNVDVIYSVKVCLKVIAEGIFLMCEFFHLTDQKMFKNSQC